MAKSVREQMVIRLSPAEKERIFAASTKAGMTNSKFVRGLVLRGLDRAEARDRQKTRANTQHNEARQ